MRVFAAIAISVFVHAMVAVGIVAYMECADNGCDAFAELDLSSVELSFSEDENQAAPPSMESFPAPQEMPPPAPPKEEIPPELEPDNTLPPEIDALKLPEPEEEREVFDVPEPEETPKKIEEPPKPNPPPQTVASAPVQAKIDAPPKQKKAIKFEYPAGAISRGEEGDVVLEIVVAADGTVKSARIIESCGFVELEAAAYKAVMSARFTPARSGKKAVESIARLTLAFKLRK